MATPIPENSAKFSLSELRGLLKPAANEAAEQLPGDSVFTGVSTDTRSNLSGKIFVALSGERYDAHRYLSQAAAAGAGCAVIEQEVEDAPAELPTLRVSSTLAALSLLGGAHRTKWGKRLLSVGGSAGKTTTRSLTAALLSHLKPGCVHTPAGNLNNRVGVPMVLLGLEPQHEYAVIEVGTNQPGEVGALAEAAAPDVGVLTLIDLEHTEGLGGLDGVEREEGELFTFSREVIIGNGDDPRVVRQSRLHESRCKSLLYGFQQGNDYQALDAELCERPPAHLSRRGVGGLCMRVSASRPDGSHVHFYTPFIGAPGVLSGLAAIASVETLLGVKVVQADVEAAFFQPGARQPGRLQPHELADGTLVIDDSYNANPASVLAGLAIAGELSELRGTRLHAVLGEMGELGAHSEAEHRRIGTALSTRPLCSLTAIGGDARLMLPAGQNNSAFVPSAELAVEQLRPHLRAGDVVFVKASRGIAAEQVVQGLLELAAPNKEADSLS